MNGIVDSHQHFWDPDRAVYPWMTPELESIRKAFTPDDLRPILTNSGVERTVLVQTRSSIEETEEFLAIAAATDFVAGVVGWVDLTSAAVAETLARLMDSPDGRWLVGIRHQVHDEPDPDWLVRADVQSGLRAVAAAGLPYDLVVRPRELPAAVDCAQRIPELSFVIDHIAKPRIGQREMEPWVSLMGEMARCPNVVCKLSGMVTEADWASWQVADLAPYVAQVVDLFGPDRLLFGSDWPVCLLAATYDQVLDAARGCLESLAEHERDAIFRSTALRTYRL